MNKITCGLVCCSIVLLCLIQHQENQTIHQAMEISCIDYCNVLLTGGPMCVKATSGSRVEQLIWQTNQSGPTFILSYRVPAAWYSIARDLPLLTITILSKPICPSSAVFVRRGLGLYSSAYYFKYCFRFNNLDASGQNYSVCCSENKSLCQ